jgi:hypothetical protein
VNPSTAVTRFEQRREALAWAERTLRQQPEDLRLEYHQAGQAVADALTQKIYSVSIQLPFRILNGGMQSLQPKLTRLRIGNVITRLLHRSCHTALIHRLHMLSEHPNRVVSESARLTCYLAAQALLTALPSQADLRDYYATFDEHGVRAAERSATADALIGQLSRRIDWLHTAEQLYPAWTTHDLYNNAAALLTAHLIEQGRALANYYTQQIIHDVRQAWRTGRITRGLTLFIPYLDERLFQMRKYTVIVIPTGRILFRPEFVIGACRLAERDVRKDTDLSQSTRWQLLTQLDSITQAFEVEIRSPR